MQDWNKYVERPYQEVLEELKAEGYQVVSDGLIACYRNVDLQKGDARIRLVCVPLIWTTLRRNSMIKKEATSWTMSSGTRLKYMMKKE